jgi:hypothetical protein
VAQSTGLNRKRQVPAEDTPAFGAIAERFRRAGDLERAVALCQEGLAKFPHTLSARVTLGWALLDLGRYDEARQALESALKRAPDNLAAIRGLAELHDRAEHTMHVPMDGPSQWPPDPAAVDHLEVDPSASSAPAGAPLKPEPLSLDTLLSGAKKKGKGKPSSSDALVEPELIQSTSHRAHKPLEPAAEAPTAAAATHDAGVDLNAILNEMDQTLPGTAAVEETGVELSAEGGDADIEKALEMAQAAAEQAAADAVATRKAAEEQSAAEAAARKAAEENAAKEAAARKVAEEKAAEETAARKAAEEKAAAEAAARKAAEAKAAEQAAAAKKAAEKAAAEAAAKQAAEQKAAAEAAAKQKAAAEAAAKKAAEEREAVQAVARESAEKAAAEARARQAAEEKAAAEAAARRAAEEKADAEAAARVAAEKAAAETARQAAEERAAAEKAAAEAARKAAEERAAAEKAAAEAARKAAEERAAAEKAAAETARQAAEERAAAEKAAAKQAAEERAAAEAAARRAAEEKAEAEAAARVAARQAAAEAEARRAAEKRASKEAAARAAAERAAQEARPGPHVNGFEVVNGSGEPSQPGAVLNLSTPVPVPRSGSPRSALPELESLLRRVESRRAQLMTESVA